MKRAYLVYAATFVLLGIGLWITLAVGETLHAPADISGVWDLQWDSRPDTETPPQAPAERLVIHQSGRFLSLEAAPALALRLKLVAGTALGDGGPALALMTGDGWTVRLDPADESGRHRLEVSGPSSLSGSVSRPATGAAETSRH